MSRIQGLPSKEWDKDFLAEFKASGADPDASKYGATGIMAHTPHMARANSAFLAQAMQGRTLSRRLLELVRLRLAFHNQCRSCMAMRFQSAVDDGLTEGMVCSLEKPMEADDLSEREKAAIEYADVFAINHFNITDETFDKLRKHFKEAEIVELGMFVAYFFGIGRLFASWDMTEELPKVYQDKSQKVAPWMAPQDVMVVLEPRAAE
jgi:AhpD family alkylhydroperoxidase